MTIQPFTFGVESRPGRFGPDSGSRIVNGYTEQAPNEATVPFFTYCRPGLKTFTGLLSGESGYRGGISLGPYGYVSIGPVLRKVDSTGTETIIGGFGGTSPVRMARNRKTPNAQIAVVSDGLRTIIENDALIGLTDTDLPPPIDVTSIAGYFVFAIADGRYFWTSIDEGTEVGALDFASAEANPDGLVAGRARGQEVVFFGEQSIEFHAFTGSSAVFERVPNTTQPIGCSARHAIAEINGVLLFPASDGTVRRLAGYAPERISNHDIETALLELTDKDSLRGWTFSHRGHQFYVLSCPSWTWVCDLLTGFWFQWDTEGLARWKAEGYLEIGNKQIVGDYNSPYLYELDKDTHDDAGDAIIWKMIGRATAYPARVELNNFYVNLVPGVGLNSADPDLEDPKAMMRVSKDNGKSWSNEKQRSVGKLGEYSKRVKFGRWGTSKEDGFMIELSMSAAVPRGISGAAADINVVEP